MKKGLIAIITVAAVAIGAGGYIVYQQKTEANAYEKQMTQTIAQLPPITVYEREDLPSIEEEFAGTEKVIDIESIQPDISNVYTAEPGDYDVKYTFNDSNGEQRTATVACTVKPNLALHVDGMKNIEIDKGEEIPVNTGCTFDEYIDSVSLSTDDVNNEEAGTYDIYYTILGTNGEMQTIDGFTCTVNEIALPTPTPTKKTKPVKELDKDSENQEEAQASETDKNINQTSEQNTNAVGNVEIQNNVVETGDENNLVALGVMMVVCLALVACVFIYKHKKNKD